jgi:hypothetical protein
MPAVSSNPLPDLVALASASCAAGSGVPEVMTSATAGPVGGSARSGIAGGAAGPDTAATFAAEAESGGGVAWAFAGAAAACLAGRFAGLTTATFAWMGFAAAGIASGADGVAAAVGIQPGGGTTWTMLWHLGQDRMSPMTDSSLTISLALQVVQWMAKCSTASGPLWRLENSLARAARCRSAVAASRAVGTS